MEVKDALLPEECDGSGYWGEQAVGGHVGRAK